MSLEQENREIVDSAVPVETPTEVIDTVPNLAVEGEVSGEAVPEISETDISVHTPSEQSSEVPVDAQRLEEVRDALFGGVNANPSHVEEAAPVVEPVVPVGARPSWGSRVRRWLGIAGAATVGLGAMDATGAEKLKEPRRPNAIERAIGWAQKVDKEMAKEKQQYPFIRYYNSPIPGWSVGPGNHTEIRMVEQVTPVGKPFKMKMLTEVTRDGRVVRAVPIR